MIISDKVDSWGPSIKRSSGFALLDKSQYRLVDLGAFQLVASSLSPGWVAVLSVFVDL